MEFGYKKQIELSFFDALQKLRLELTNEGFGVITEIDARETFQKKLNIDFGNYIILGVCHPLTAYKVLSIDKELGLLLPCNVIIYEEDGKVVISTILPVSVMSMFSDSRLDTLAEEIEKKLKNVINKF